MKCLCGFEEVRGGFEETEVLYVRGPKKGQVKKIQQEYIFPIEMESMDIGNITLKFCPDCGLTYKEGYY